MNEVAGGSEKLSKGVSGLVKKTPRLYCSIDPSMDALKFQFST